MKLLVGLGNPGEKYEGTRHNLGFQFLDDLRHKLNAGEWSPSDKFKAEVLKALDLYLVRPLTYMNNSGMAVAHIADYYKIAPEDIVIIHDDMDLPLGSIKIRRGGAAAGHHGVESIIDKLGSDNFVRIRMGVGNWKTQSSEHGGNSLNAEHYVLEEFLPNEKSRVKQMLKHAIQALERYLEDGLEAAQSQFN